MFRHLARVASTGCAAWLFFATSASAQVGAARPANPNPYAAPYNTSTVSPYLNLGTTPSGISNYQSLVRPLLDERESADAYRNKRQTVDARAVQQPGNGQPDGKTRTASPGRFFYYSHYFAPSRER